MHCGRPRFIPVFHQTGIGINSKKAAGDPFNLNRYASKQRRCFDQALTEINRGRKTSCWMWYVIPTPPFVVKGVEMGSTTNKYYSIPSDEEAHAFLRYAADGVDLRHNYCLIMQAVFAQLCNGVQASVLMGSTDAPKLFSSAKYFEELTRNDIDKQVNAVCLSVLRFATDVPSKIARSHIAPGRALQKGLAPERGLPRKGGERRNSLPSEACRGVPSGLSRSQSCGQVFSDRNADRVKSSSKVRKIVYY